MSISNELSVAHDRARISRQRSNSETLADDLNIQATNDDAATCKCWLVKLGYYTDPYLTELVCHKLNNHRPAPEINRGYFARVRAVRMLVEKFLKVAGPSGQIVSLGAGFDTLFWQLKDSDAQLSRFVEVDFPCVASKKIHAIMKKESNLHKHVDEFGDINQSEHIDLHSKQYHLLGLDLRNTKELISKLETSNVDFNAPTLILSECVLVYMTNDNSARLLKCVANRFTHAVYVNYEQVNVDDKFGHIMQDNLHLRGVCLAGLAPCKNLTTQKQRFIDAGFSNATGWDMNKVYFLLPRDEIARIERLEMLDETELLTQLCQHYCITVACKSGGTKYDFSSVGL